MRSGASIISAAVIVDDVPTLAEAFVRHLTMAAEEALAARGSFAIALSGGSVARAFLPCLAHAPLDVSRLAVFWADERAVAPDHPDSNYGLARSLWLAPAGIPDTAIRRMTGEALDLEGAADDYERALVRRLGAPPRLDVVLLGVGPDGHVASLFPGHPALDESRRQVVALTDAPKPPPRRVTLTLPALVEARLVVVAAFGAEKAEAIRQALEDAGSPLPIARVARRAPRTLWLLDPEAARALRPGSRAASDGEDRRRSGTT
jgi:6-phosphogluconolactonase